MNVIERAQQWVDHDPDPATAAELASVVEAARAGDESALAELNRAMNGPLQFGTAGLRGEIGPGESRMNLSVVIRATAGLCAVLLKHATRAPRVVIGCDARYGSVDFANAAARVASAAGCEVLLLPLKNPTPLTAFSVRELDADAGIMVTASHNPPRDNGYKVYLGGTVVTGAGQGVQIVSPFDAEIASAIASAPFADQIAQNDELIVNVDPREDYIARAASLAQGSPEIKEDLAITLTAMHGVGAALTQQVLNEAGFTNVSLVAEQVEPDPDFPTVSFPNPEEPGALDLAIAHACANGSDLIIAVDPDADRCALAVPDEASSNGWRQLSGDETGSLLGEFLAGSAPEDAVFANSIVSSRLLGKIAQGHGLKYQHTLTGFKWIARVPGLYFGYEEAIGYCCDPAHVRDKDGITAAVTMALLVAGLRADGRAIQDVLDSFAERFGLHATAPVTFRVEDIGLISAAMQQLRSTAPAELAGSEVVSVIDLGEGYNGLPPTDGLILLTAANDRVIIRPSGTEPKLKCYLEVILPGGTWEEARKRLDAIGEELRGVIGL